MVGSLTVSLKETRRVSHTVGLGILRINDQGYFSTERALFYTGIQGIYKD